MDYKIYVKEKLLVDTNNYTLVKKIARKKIQEYGEKNVAVYYKNKKMWFFK